MSIFYPPPQPTQIPPPWAPIPTQGQQPPPGPGLVQVNMRTAVSGWPPQWWPAQSAPQTVALTLTYGQQPPSYSIVNMMEEVLSWPPQWWPGQAVYSPIVPLTLTYGQQPPRYSTADLNVEVASWQPPFQYPYGLIGTAAWNVPAIVVVPYTTLPASILTAWIPPWQQPQTPPRTAPLTLVYGQNPPPYSIVTLGEVVALWQPPFQMPQVLETVVQPAFYTPTAPVHNFRLSFDVTHNFQVEMD